MTALLEAVENRTRPLVISDRCDGCGAQALIVARSMETNKELFFCNHHGSEHKEALLDSGFYMDTETLDLRD